MGICLNPCFDGRCGGTTLQGSSGSSTMRLNPCFGGRCRGAPCKALPKREVLLVLILVLVEDVGGQIVEEERVLRAYIRS